MPVAGKLRGCDVTVVSHVLLGHSRTYVCLYDCLIAIASLRSIVQYSKVKHHLYSEP